MTFPIGGGRVNPAPCNDEEWDQFAQDVAITINNSGGSDTDEKFAAVNGAVAGYWSDIVAGEDTFVEGTHQDVLWFRDGNIIHLFTPATGGGGSDAFTVKVSSGGTADFLDAKIHADTWEPSDTYGSSTHFIILAADVSDAVRFYAPYNIIKNSSSDGAPGYLYAKLADTGTYSALTHTLVSAQDLGSTLRLFVTNSDIVTISQASQDHKVKVDSADTTPDYLHNKIKDATTYNPDLHQPVYSEAVDTGDKSVRLFTNIATASTGVLGRVVGSASGDCADFFIIQKATSPEDEVELYLYANNAHAEYGVDLPTGALVQVIGNIGWSEDNPPTCPDITDPDTFPTAALLNVHDYLKGMEGYDDKKALYVDVGLFTYDIGFGGEDCNPEA